MLLLQHARRELHAAWQVESDVTGRLTLKPWSIRIGMAESELVDYSLGRSKRERAYREWALGLRLFLNTLNDLLTKSAAVQDVLTLPSHQIGSAGITFLAFYNQLKQEYAFARWNLFEGTRHQPLHPADRRLSLAFNATTRCIRCPLSR